MTASTALLQELSARAVALDAADSAFRDGRIDVSKMEELLASLLANQLAQFYRSAGGKLPD